MIDWDLEIAEETKAINIDPSDKDAYKRRGIARCYKSGNESDCEKAIEDLSLSQVLGDEDKDWSLQYYRALVYYQKKDYMQAEKILTAKSCRVDDPYKSELLGFVYYTLRNYEKAVQNFEQALEKYYKLKSINSGLFPGPALFDAYKKALKALKGSA